MMTDRCLADADALPFSVLSLPMLLNVVYFGGIKKG
jgi:hypothetical protein